MRRETTTVAVTSLSRTRNGMERGSWELAFESYSHNNNNNNNAISNETNHISCRDIIQGHLNEGNFVAGNFLRKIDGCSFFLVVHYLFLSKYSIIVNLGFVNF